MLWQAGLADALRTLAGADWRWVALAAVSAVVAMAINVKRWQVMLAGQGGGASLGTLIRLYLIAMFFNNVLPSRFAGDVVRAYGASINVTTKTRSAAAVIMDRLVGAISVLLLGVIAIVVNPSVIPWQLDPGAGGRAGRRPGGGRAAADPDAARTARRATLLTLFERLPVLGRRLGGRVQAAVEAVRAYAGKPGLIAWALLISMVANGLSIVNIYLYALAVGADVRLAEAAVVAPVVLAVGLLPLSINGLGHDRADVRGAARADGRRPRGGAGGGDPAAAGAAGPEPGRRSALLGPPLRLTAARWSSGESSRRSLHHLTLMWRTPAMARRRLALLVTIPGVAAERARG